MATRHILEVEIKDRVIMQMDVIFPLVLLYNEYTELSE